MKYLVPLLLISITTAHTWAAEDLEPRAQAPKPLNVMSTEVAPIPIERDIFPNKDLLFYGYYGTANLQPQLIAVQKKFPDLLAKAIDRNFQRKNLTLEKLTPTQQKIVQDDLAAHELNNSRIVGSHSNFLDIGYGTPNRKRKISTFISKARPHLVGTEDDPLIRTVNGKERSYQGGVLLGLNFVWNRNAQDAIKQSGQKFSLKLKRYGDIAQPSEAPLNEDGSVDNRELYVKLLHQAWYELGIDKQLQYVTIVDTVDEPYLNVRATKEFDRMYKEMTDLNTEIHRSFVQYTHCFKEFSHYPENCKNAHKTFAKLGPKNLGLGRDIFIRTNFSGVFYKDNLNLKIPHNTDIVSYDCYGPDCVGKALPKYIAHMRSKMTCDQELFLIPEAWQWEKEKGEKGPAIQSLHKRTAYHWDQALLDSGIEKKGCTGRVNKIIGFAMFIWASFDWNDKGTHSHGSGSNFFAKKVKTFSGEPESYHELLKKITDMMFGHRNREQLTPN